MPAIDIVTANEFTFTPSAFIAAYIEQEEKTTVTDTSSNSGSLNVSPQEVKNIFGIPDPVFVSTLPQVRIGSNNFQAQSPFKSHPLNHLGIFADIGDQATIQTLGAVNVSGEITAFTSTNNTLSYSMGILSPVNTGQVTASGSLADLIGQITTDTRSTTKTTTTSNAVANTVVLVLSYGQFRSKCTDAQATVSAIYSAVNAYLSSL